jgi:hypothetical protein
VNIHGNAPAVVRDLQRSVGVQDHLDTVGMTGDGLVGGVVDHLLGHVIGPLGVGVHGRPALDRFQAFEHLHRGGGVFGFIFGVEQGAVFHACGCSS